MKAKIETAVFLLLICLGAIPVWEPLITCLTDMGPHNNKMNLTGLVGDYDDEHKGIKAYRWMKCNIHLYAFCFSTIIQYCWLTKKKSPSRWYFRRPNRFKSILRQTGSVKALSYQFGYDGVLSVLKVKSDPKWAKIELKSPHLINSVV